MTMPGDRDSDSEKERISRLMDLEKKMLPSNLRELMPKEEWKGLTLLVNVLDTSTSCHANERGTIVARYDDRVEIVLLFEKMVRKRLEWLARYDLQRPTEYKGIKPDCHLHALVRRWTIGEGEELPISVRNTWGDRVCIVANGADEMPVTDIAATFVLWADSGFDREPATLSDRVAFIRRCETHADFLEEKERLRREKRMRLERARNVMRLEALRRDEQEREDRRNQDTIDRINSLGWRELMEAYGSLSVDNGANRSWLSRLIHNQLDPERRGE